jgi:hypothetical protein
MNALRGHSNIQGLTDLGLMNNLLGLPDLTGREGGKQSHVPAEPRLQAAAPRPAQLLAESSQILCQLPEFDVRRGSTADNDFCYEWLPKLDVVCDVRRAFELMHQGRSTAISARASTRLWHSRTGPRSGPSCFVCRSCFADEDGSLTNSGAGCSGIGKALTDPVRAAATS